MIIETFMQGHDVKVQASFSTADADEPNQKSVPTRSHSRKLSSVASTTVKAAAEREMGSTPKSFASHRAKFQEEYKTPSTGIFSLFSDQWRPYAELARLDKPGFALLWIIHICGVLPASILNNTPARDVIALVVFFLPACQVLMWFNFAYNDTCDVVFDRQVLRTRHRPLARNALTRQQALAFDALLASILILFLIPLPVSCASCALVLGSGCLIYPLTKRFTNHPQAFLGFVGAGGVYMGAAAAGVDPLPYPSRIADIFAPQTWHTPSITVSVAIAGQYLAIAAWVIETEIVYSYQDAEWDEAAGVGTITRLIPGHKSAKMLLFLLASAQVSLLGLVGKVLELESNFWTCSLGATAASLIFSISSVDLKSPESCLTWFQLGNLATGASMLFGLSAEYWLTTRLRAAN